MFQFFHNKPQGPLERVDDTLYVRFDSIYSVLLKHVFFLFFSKWTKNMSSVVLLSCFYAPTNNS